MSTERNTGRAVETGVATLQATEQKTSSQTAARKGGAALRGLRTGTSRGGHNLGRTVRRVLRSTDLAAAAAALGRKGGLASKRAGVDFAALGRKGGLAGKGSKKPRRVTDPR